MADAKDIEIKLRATGGDSTAKEVEKVEEAVGDLGKATAEVSSSQSSPAKLVPAWKGVATAAEDAATATDDAGTAMGDAAKSGDALDDVLDHVKSRSAELRGKLDELRQQIRGTGGAADAAAGAKGGGGLKALGGRLLSMVGGPVGIAAAAFAMLAGVIAKWKQTLDEAKQSIDAVAEPVWELDAATSGAAEGLGRYSAELKTISDTMATNAAGMEEEIDRAERLARATDNLAKATIDAKVARGELSAEEGAAQKGEIEIEAMERRLQGALEKAEIEKARANEDARLAREAERQAAEEAERARKQGEERVTGLERNVVAAETKGLKAATITSTNSGSANYGAEVIKQLGGEKEARLMLDEMKGATAYAAKLIVAAGGSVEDALDTLGPLLGDGFAKMLADEAAEEKEAAVERLKKAKEAQKEKEAERQRELDAIKATREAAEKQAAQAGKAYDRAQEDVALAEKYEIPAMQTRVDTARDKEEKRRQQEADDKAAKLKAEEAKRQADEEAARIAADAARAAGRGREAGADPATIKALDSAATKLSDGTNLNELGGALLSLSTAAENLAADQRATVMGLIARMKATEQNLKTVQDQLRNNPNRG